MDFAKTMEMDGKRGYVERRTGNRHISVFRVGRLIDREGDQICVIRNISSGGVMIEANRLPPSGARVFVETRSDRRIPATVRWVHEREADVQFDQEIDVAAMLREERPSILRNQPRAPRFVRPGKVKVIGTVETIEGDIANISINGVGIRTPTRFALDEPVIVAIDGLGAARAVVRWWVEGEIGVRLQSPLSYRLLANWLDDRDPAKADPA